MLQIVWSELVEPKFTEENREEYLEIGLDQVKPIGNIVNGRMLLHGIGTKSQIDEMLDFVSGLEKSPKVVRVSDRMDIPYGFEEKQDPETELITIKPVSGLVPYKKTDSTDYFKGKTKIIDGTETIITPAFNQMMGWRLEKYDNRK